MLVFLLIVTFIAVAILNYFYYSYKYWERKGVPTLKPKFPLGNGVSVLPRGFSIGAYAKKYYDDLRKERHKFGGIYLVTEPNLVITDPEYIRDIVTKDFQYFVDRGFYHNAEKDPISAHLFAIDGQKWRNLRTKLTPTFTSGKMKMMFNTILECSENMKDALGNCSEYDDIDIKEILGRFTTDVIGSCAFGIECNSFKHPDAEFRQMGKKIFDYDIFKSIVGFMSLNFPTLSLKMGLYNNRPEIQKFFIKVVRDTVRFREENNINRNDFLQILIDLKNQASGDASLDQLRNAKGEIFTLNEIAAQVFLFFVAGFETSSTAMSFGLYQLARHPEMQEKLRQNVNEILAKYNNKITYESLKEIKYLDQVLDETLRMYPPVPTINRRCVRNYKLRDSNLEIEAGTKIMISALGLHMDPEYHAEPEQFNPERFSDENKSNIKPFTYIPFGEGPRNCIGLRFGVMQSKIGIVTLVKNYKWTLSPNTKEVEFNPKGFLLSSIDNIYLKIEKI